VLATSTAPHAAPPLSRPTPSSGARRSSPQRPDGGRAKIQGRPICGGRMRELLPCSLAHVRVLLDGELLCSGATRRMALTRAGVKSWERGPARMALLRHSLRYGVDWASRENEVATPGRGCRGKTASGSRPQCCWS
jgi:hypothetical protein